MYPFPEYVRCCLLFVVLVTYSTTAAAVPTVTITTELSAASNEPSDRKATLSGPAYKNRKQRSVAPATRNITVATRRQLSGPRYKNRKAKQPWINRITTAASSRSRSRR